MSGVSDDQPPAVIREGLELFNQREYERSIASLPTTIEWDTSAAVPDGELHRGREAVLALWLDIDRRWDEFRIEPERWVVGHDAVLMQGRLRARGADSGVPIEGVWDQIWRLEDGEPVRCENYTDRDQARAAFGVVA